MDRIPGEDLDSRGRGNREAQRLSLGTRGPLCFSSRLALAVDLQGPDTLSSLPELTLLDGRVRLQVLVAPFLHVHIQ